MVESTKTPGETNYYTATQKSFVTKDFCPETESNIKKRPESPKKVNRERKPSQSPKNKKRQKLEECNQNEDSEEELVKDNFMVSFGAKEKQQNIL